WSSAQTPDPRAAPRWLRRRWTRSGCGKSIWTLRELLSSEINPYRSGHLVLESVSPTAIAPETDRTVKGIDDGSATLRLPYCGAPSAVLHGSSRRELSATLALNVGQRRNSSGAGVLRSVAW